MTPLPKRKLSKGRTRRRRNSYSGILIAQTVKCKNCGADKLPHRLCANCGKK
ncbi:50S ribosomal protein L32 [candidate division WWE3 bacterium]|nr:50S ribosomal protein L32 [candidate division WWE3 bacterium]